MDSCRRFVWLTLREARDVIESGELIIGAHLFRELEARLDLREEASRRTKPERGRC